MTFDEYQAGTRETDKSAGTLEYYFLGLCGESGEAADHIKKSLRVGEYHKPIDTEAVLYELGDVLFYITRAAEKLGSSLENVAIMNKYKLAKRYGTDRSDVELLGTGHYTISEDGSLVWKVKNHEKRGRRFSWESSR